MKRAGLPKRASAGCASDCDTAGAAARLVASASSRAVRSRGLGFSSAGKDPAVPPPDRIQPPQPRPLPPTPQIGGMLARAQATALQRAQTLVKLLALPLPPS